MKLDGKLELIEFQRRILGPALTLQEDGTFLYNRLLYSTIKKSGKTAVAGSIGAWAAECFPPGTEIYCIANDQESSKGRVFSDIEYHAQFIEGVYITSIGSPIRMGPSCRPSLNPTALRPARAM